MFKNAIHVTISGIILVVVTIACSLSGSSPSETQSPNQFPTSSILIQPSPTESPSLLPTSVPQMGLKQEWLIKTGDIQYIGVASDGTVYGVGPKLYAIISKDGEVLQTNEMDFTNCIRDNFSGGASDTEIDRWFTIRSDGIILTTTSSRPCIISPGNPPSVEKLEGDYFPYADEIKSRKTPSTPAGFTNNFGGYLYFSHLTTYDFFVSTNKRLAAFVDHNGEIRYFDLPQDLDVEKRLNELRVGVTPWDDVYLSYPAYDALGNDLGQKNIKIEENGTVNPIGSFPYLVKTIANMNSIANLAWIHPIYLPERNLAT